MKTKLRISSIALLLVIFFAGSCKKENLTTLTAEGSVEFSYGVKSGKSTKANTKPFAAIVSITDENDQTVVENQELKFYNINGSYLTEKLTLTAGNYKLSHYVIVSQTNEVLYATPKQGSELAYLVNTPLTIDITVAEEQASQTIPEVIEVADFTADQFGYSYFGLQKVEIFNFAVDLFTKDADTEVLSPATGTITVTGDAVELFSGQLEAKTNAIYLRDGYTNYTVTIEKEGYSTYTKTFTIDELKAHSNAQGNNPLTVILDNNSIAFTVELPTASEFSFVLNGPFDKKVNIDWGDGSEIQQVGLLYSNPNHLYDKAGTYTIYLTGDIEFMSEFQVYDKNITQIDLSKAINLSLLSCNKCSLPSIDISNNTKLSYLILSHNKLTELDVTNNSALTNLHCGWNLLSNLDISNNISITSLTCQENKLINLDISNNVVLESLSCNYNTLNSLDLSNNNALETLWCNDNQLTKLNVQNGNNANLKNLGVRNNPNLTTICVDDGFENGATGWSKDDTAIYSRTCQ